MDGRQGEGGGEADRQEQVSLARAIESGGNVDVQLLHARWAWFYAPALKTGWAQGGCEMKLVGQEWLTANGIGLQVLGNQDKLTVSDKEVDNVVTMTREDARAILPLLAFYVDHGRLPSVEEGRAISSCIPGQV